jgi:hypothetical protein
MFPQYTSFISNFDIFILIFSYVVNTNELFLMLKIIGQCDVKHIMTLPIKIITSFLKISTNITSMEALSDSLWYYW